MVLTIQLCYVGLNCVWNLSLLYRQICSALSHLHPFFLLFIFFFNHLPYSFPVYAFWVADDFLKNTGRAYICACRFLFVIHRFFAKCVCFANLLLWLPFADVESTGILDPVLLVAKTCFSSGHIQYLFSVNFECLVIYNQSVTRQSQWDFEDP